MSNPKAQSVRDRLVRIAADRKEDFNLLLIRFASERLLYRLSKTEFVDRFVLKGASLFLIWEDQPHRPTRDIDLLGFGPITEDEIRRIFSTVAQVDVESDGLEFNADGITVSEIREGEIYQGLQVKLPGVLGAARVSVQIDIGTGDIITPAPKVVEYPTLLDLPAPRLKIYPPETVVAEKLDAIIALGIRNSRMKDYFDLWTLCQNHDFDEDVLAEALRATLQQRGRAVPPGIPIGLSDEFATDSVKQTQWKAFTRRSIPAGSAGSLPSVVSSLRAFLVPILQRACSS